MFRKDQLILILKYFVKYDLPVSHCLKGYSNVILLRVAYTYRFSSVSRSYLIL
jgi:hypothetical protein